MIGVILRPTEFCPVKNVDRDTFDHGGKRRGPSLLDV